MFARFCSLMRCPPTMIRAGSPGTNRTMKKTIDVIKNINGISVTSRVSISRAINLASVVAESRASSQCCGIHTLRGVDAIEEVEQNISVMLMVFQMHSMTASWEYLQFRSGNT